MAAGAGASYLLRPAMTSYNRLPPGSACVVGVWWRWCRPRQHVSSRPRRSRACRYRAASGHTSRLICADPTLADTRVLGSPPSISMSTSTLRSGPAQRVPAQGRRSRRALASDPDRCRRGSPARPVDHQAADHRVRQTPRPPTPPAQLADLTKREREILQLVAAGLSNADIARRLVISPLTAKTHVARILAKLGCHDRAQLVALAYETGLVTPGSRDKTKASDAA